VSLDQAAAELMENNGFRFVYDRSKFAPENYQAWAAIQPFFYPYLERHAPARFEAVHQQYTAQIAAVDGFCHGDEGLSAFSRDSQFANVANLRPGNS